MNSANSFKTSLIIATYNWKEALKLVLISVKKQTVLPIEIIIADDGSNEDTKELINYFKSVFKIPLVHIWHEDKGFRLAEIRNKAIKQAKGNYIIQIDGDVILHKDFVKDHINNAEKGAFLVGSRVLLGKKNLNQIFKNKKINFSFFNKNITNRQYTLRIPFLSKLLKSPSSNIEKVIKSARGCNMSFWKSDLITVNGYNEAMVGWGREDSEISARLIHLGLVKHRVKFSSIQYHIYHPEKSRDGINMNDTILNNTVENNIVFAKNGIEKNKKFHRPNKVTAIIPTYNEEANIESAIENVSFADEILIIDSFSTDKTISLAEKYNVKIIQRKFDNFSSQKNHAISEATNNWILMLDADERFSESAIKEILSILNRKIYVDAFWMYRLNYFNKKIIKYSGWQNDKVIKLFNRKNAKYNGKLVHEEIECKGKTEFLKKKLLHYTYRNKFDYIHKITLYANLKAQELFEQGVKPNIYHFYFKPMYRFIYHYIIKLGFLDGKKGKMIASINAYGIKKRYQELEKLYEKPTK